MKKKSLIAGAAALAAAALVGIAPICVWAAEPVPEGVFVGGRSLAGMTDEEAEQAIEEYVEEKRSRIVIMTVGDGEVSVSAGDLGLSWENRDELKETLEGTKISGSLIKRYMRQRDLLENPVSLEPELSVEQEKISAFVSEQCGEALTEAQNASIKRENGEFVITPSSVGLTVDFAATEQSLREALKEEGSGEIRIDASVTEQQPEITTEELETIQDVLGTFSTDFSSSGASRSTNLTVGSAKINGRVLMPGEILSGYECMQPFTYENGYRTAIAYENGRSVDSIGGGVCQISSTLYNAALLAEMDIVQRQNHSMSVSYVKPSMDAAIAGTYKDLKIRNPYDTPVYVEGYTSGKTLTFTIYGQENRPENRTISFESETLRRIDPGAPTEQVDPTLAPGQRVRVQSGHTGLQSRLYKCIYVDGELTERILLNTDTYNASKAIYRVGPAAEAAAQPEAPAETPAETSAVPVETVPAPVETEAHPAGPGYEYGPGMPTPAETQAAPAANTQPQSPADSSAFQTGGPGAADPPTFQSDPGAAGPGA